MTATNLSDIFSYNHGVPAPKAIIKQRLQWCIADSNVINLEINSSDTELVRNFSSWQGRGHDRYGVPRIGKISRGSESGRQAWIPSRKAHLRGGRPISIRGIDSLRHARRYMKYNVMLGTVENIYEPNCFGYATDGDIYTARYIRRALWTAYFDRLRHIVNDELEQLDPDSLYHHDIKYALRNMVRRIYVEYHHFEYDDGPYRTMLELMLSADVFPFGLKGAGSKVRDLINAVRKPYEDAMDVLREAWEEAEVSVCGHCGKIVVGYTRQVDGYGDVCNICIRSGEFIYSDCMDTHLLRGDAYRVYLGERSIDGDEDDVCTYDYGRYEFHEMWDEDDNIVFADDECYEYNTEDEYSDTIGDYHSSRGVLEHIPAKDDNPSIGFELEFERDNTRRYLCDYAYEILDEVKYYEDEDGYSYRYAHLEHDGSLDDGFEMVTSWTGLSVHEEMMRKLLVDSEATDGLISHDTSTCGLHVHISKANMSMVHQTKMAIFINAPENQVPLDKFARRKSNSYAKRGVQYSREQIQRELRTMREGGNYDYSIVASHPLAIVKARYYRETGPAKETFSAFIKRNPSVLASVQDERYRAINFLPKNTVELRLFRGTRKFETLMATLEFANALYWYTKEASWSKLTMDDFVAWLPTRPDVRSKYLRTYLVVRGIATVKNIGLVQSATTSARAAA